jgi:polyisoprenoid-binding protein YceI
VKHIPVLVGLVLTLGLGAASMSAAETTPMVADRAHSEVGFNIRHFFNKVHGRFNDYTIQLAFDPANLTASTVEAVIRDSSIDTGYPNRDHELRGPDFFWYEKFPTVTFKSGKVVAGKDANHFQVLGDLTIRDVTKPVTLDLEYLGSGKIGRKGSAGLQAGFLARTTIDRKEYGIVWNRTLDEGGVMLGDDVEIVLNIAAYTPPPAKPVAKAPTPAETPTAENKDKK